MDSGSSSPQSEEVKSSHAPRLFRSLQQRNERGSRDEADRPPTGITSFWLTLGLRTCYVIE